MENVRKCAVCLSMQLLKQFDLAIISRLLYFEESKLSDTYCYLNQPGRLYVSACDKQKLHELENSSDDQCRNRSSEDFAQTSSIFSGPT